MKIYDLKKNNYSDKTYYYIVLNVVNGEYFMVKNAGCHAGVEHFLEDKYSMKFSEVEKTFRIFFNGTDDFINLKNIYKKYHKFFKNI